MHPRGFEALRLAKLGLRIHPLKPGTKQPALEGWQERATTDPKTIVAWWTQGPYNIGIATGRPRDEPDAAELVIEDFDCKHGKKGLETFREYEAAGLVETLLVRTATGGIHAYFWRRATNGSGAPIASSVEHIAPGLDILGDGGNLVGPGSQIGEGIYEIIKRVAIADLPSAVEEKAPRASATRKADQAPVGELDSEFAIERVRRYLAEEAPLAIEGAGGDNTTYRVAARCKDLGVTEEQCLELMDAEGGWNSRCSPPWDGHELERKIRNAYRYGTSAPGSANAREEFAEQIAENLREMRKWKHRLPMDDWDAARIPEREWAVPGVVPLRQVGLLTGEGGTGKSIIELMRSVAHVTGKDWLGMPVKRGPVLYFGCEDDERELQIRLMLIAKHYGVTFKDLVRDGLHVWSMCDKNAVLVEPGERGSGKMIATQLYRELHQFCRDVRPVNISLDTLSHVFAGNELVRTEVYAFATLMRALARTAGGSVTVLAHPSLSGMASGSGISGSTAWHGAFRFRQYMHGPKKQDAGDDDQPDTNKRELEFKKNQYGPLGQTIGLRYADGLFLPTGGITIEEREEVEATADGLFMALLTRYMAQGRSVHHSSASIHYAPKIFAKDEEAEKHGVRMKGFEAAMKRLFSLGRIRTVPYGKPSKGGMRLEPVV